MITNFFNEAKNQLEKGENAYSSGNVTGMIFDPDVSPAMLKGTVIASMKKRTYSVEISIDSEDGILLASCTCPRGQVICHHMAALAIHAHHNVSITDKACAWNVPKGAHQLEEVFTIEDMYIPKKPDYCATGRAITEEETSTFVQQLRGNIIGFSWLLQPEISQEAETSIPQIAEIMFSAEFQSHANKISYLLEKLKCTSEQRRKIIEVTTGQSKNENWLMARKHRLTASHFGAILAACKRGRYPPSLFRRLVDGYNLQRVQAIEWGRCNEKSALEAFSAAMDLPVTPTGLWLDKCGYLGASPDGLIGDDAVVEAKCPFKYRNTSLFEGLKQDPDYIISINPESQQVEINCNHAIWHQIQGQLFLTDRLICHLIIWSPTQCQIVKVERDEGWRSNLNLLKTFYIERYIPYICGEV